MWGSQRGGRQARGVIAFKRVWFTVGWGESHTHGEDYVGGQKEWQAQEEYSSLYFTIFLCLERWELALYTRRAYHA